MSLKSIEDEWNGFSQMVFRNVNPSPVQVEEMKRAFFGGAWAILCALKRIGEPDISEEEGIQYFEDREQEGQQFYRDLIKRYAEGN